MKVQLCCRLSSVTFELMQNRLVAGEYQLPLIITWSRATKKICNGDKEKSGLHFSFTTNAFFVTCFMHVYDRSLATNLFSVFKMLTAELYGIKCYISLRTNSETLRDLERIFDNFWGQK